MLSRTYEVFKSCTYEILGRMHVGKPDRGAWYILNQRHYLCNRLLHTSHFFLKLFKFRHFYKILLIKR